MHGKFRKVYNLMANVEISSFELGSNPANNVRISNDQCSKLQPAMK
jgi:hypothetical protein